MNDVDDEDNQLPVPYLMRKQMRQNQPPRDIIMRITHQEIVDFFETSMSSQIELSDQ